MFSWPFPATTKTSPLFKFLMASDIAIDLLEISLIFLTLIPFLISFLIFTGFS